MHIGEIFAFLSAIFWAIGAGFYKKGLETTDVWSGNLMRTGFTSLGFIIFMVLNDSLIESINALTLELVFWLIFSAFFAFFLGDVLYLASIKECGVAKAVPISSTYPIFVSVWSFLLFGKLSLYVLFGAILIVMAIKLISKGEEKNSLKGIFLAISASISWSLSITVLELLTSYLPSEAVAGFRFIIAFMFLNLIVAKNGFNFSWNSLLWMGVGGMFVMVLGNYVFVEAIKLIGSAKVSPISAVYPILSAVFAGTVLREKITLRIIAGTLLSFAGVLLVLTG
ncbi:putative membrane protein [Archaeoglobus sulfaticallidus PM70-1]|uniref:Putative membrane protein n=1 Tax=Archaeoglobus sulfaticallidus PM70-1 TaxID=387631 RepID=N0BGI1_9EURY|nr:DMT family transporter [Archaeoglobus sulfaticallidus]AGK62108.1 putative membrane protein [Archaeoglobus sulfaticallidus PM70-1]